MRRATRFVPQRLRPLNESVAPTTDLSAPLHFVAPSTASPSPKSLVLHNVKPFVAGLLMQARSTVPHFLMSSAQDRDIKRSAASFFARLQRQHVCQILLGILQELRQHQQKEAAGQCEPMQNMCDALPGALSSGLVVPTSHFVMYALLCVAPNAKGFQSLLDINKNNVGLSLERPATRVRLAQCLLSCYDVRPRAMTPQDFFPAFEPKSQLVAFAKAVVKILLPPPPPVAHGAAGGAAEEQPCEPLAEVVDHCCSCCAASSSLSWSSQVDRLADASTTLAALVFALLVLSERRRAGTVLHQCASLNTLIPLPVLSLIDNFEKEAQTAVVAMFVAHCRSRAYALGKGGPLLSSMALVLALLNSLDLSNHAKLRADGVAIAQMLRQLDITYLHTSIDLQLNGEAKDSGKRGVSNHREQWEALFDALSTLLIPNPRSDEASALRSAAVELFTRIITSWSPPGKDGGKSQDDAATKQLRLGANQQQRQSASAAAVAAVRESELARTMTADAIPHGSVASFVSRMLEVGELHASAVSLSALHTGGKILLSYYNVALLSGAVAAAKLTGTPYRGLLGLVNQRKIVFGPDTLEPQLLTRDTMSPAGRENTMMCANLGCSSVFSSWRSYGATVGSAS